MRIVMMSVASAVALAAGAPAFAQQVETAQPVQAQPTQVQAAQAQASESDASNYLCSFAGKCDTTEGATPLKAAPATKGFRLATAQAAPADTPTRAAPATRGFRLAQSTQTRTAPNTRGFRLARAQAGTTPQPTVRAPDTRSFRVARATSTQTAAVPAERDRRVGRGQNRYVRTARTVGTPGVGLGVPRTDLLLSFDANSAQMTPAGEARARTFARALMMDELKSRRFMIAGHTDARGKRDANVDLSRRRAQTVADFLIAQGVDRSRVEVRGVGPDEPLPGRTPAADSNRRVEAVLLS